MNNNFRYNIHGSVDCEIKHDAHGWIPTTLTEEESKKVIDSGAEIAPYVALSRTNDQLIAEIDLELSALDATPRMLSGALMGDQWAKDQISDNEIKQSALRDKRKALI